MAVLCNFCDGCFADGTSHDCPGRGPTILYGDDGPPAKLARYLETLPDGQRETVRTVRRPHPPRGGQSKYEISPQTVREVIAAWEGVPMDSVRVSWDANDPRLMNVEVVAK